MRLKTALDFDKEYYRNFCETSEREGIMRYRDYSLKDMYYHNFSIITGDFSKDELKEKVEKEISFRKEEGENFCNIFLERVPEFKLDDLFGIKPEVSISGYYTFDNDRLKAMTSREDCTVKRVKTDEMVEDIVYADLQSDEKTLGRDFCERRARRRGKVYTSDTGVDAYICYHDGEIIGSCEMFIKDNTAKIDDFTVIPDFQRKGYGTAILKSVMKIALESGVENIYLMTDEEDTAKDMYVKLGFVKIGESVEMFFEI